MYWWNVNALARELRAGTVSEYELFKYYLATSILLVAGLNLIPRAFSQNIFIEIGRFFIEILMVIFGLYICYRSNKKGDGKNFIARITALSWPIGIRLFVYVLSGVIFFNLLMVILEILHIVSITMVKQIFDSPIYEMIAIVVPDVVFYYWLNRKVSFVSKKDTVTL